MAARAENPQVVLNGVAGVAVNVIDSQRRLTRYRVDLGPPALRALEAGFLQYIPSNMKAEL
jgi:hypothetical protein